MPLEQPVTHTTHEWIIFVAAISSMLVFVLFVVIASYFFARNEGARINEKYRVWADVYFSYQTNSQQPTVHFNTNPKLLFQSVDKPDYWKLYVKHHFEEKHGKPFFVKVDGKII